MVAGGLDLDGAVGAGGTDEFPVSVCGAIMIGVLAGPVRPAPDRR
jgi:hypothetical protein